MPAGGREAPLAVQAERLQKSQERRAERRRAARGRSLAARGRDGGAPAPGALEEHKVWGGATGGVSLGAGAGQRALPEATNIVRCDLCGISVTSRAEWQQHIAGVAHRKAVERQRAEQEGSTGPGAAAQAALEAASWAARVQEGGAVGLVRPGPCSIGASEHAVARARPGGARGGEYRGGQDRAWTLSAREEGKGAAGKRASGQGGLASKGLKVSHTDLVRQAAAKSRKGGESLSLGGWVPPSISVQQSRRPAQASEASGVGRAETRGGAEIKGVQGDTSGDEGSAGGGDEALLGLGGYASDSDGSG